jgi:hypothetical protein
MEEPKSQVKGKVLVGSGVYGNKNSGYTVDENGHTILPSHNKTGGQLGEKTEFEITEVGAKAKVKPETTRKATLSRDKNFNRNVTIEAEPMGQASGEKVKEAPIAGPPVFENLNKVYQDQPMSQPMSQPMAQPQYTEPTHPLPPKVKVAIANELFKLSLKWHSVLIEPSESGAGYTIVLISDLEFDPDFEINIPMGVTYDLTISAEDGSITTCKDSFYGGQSFRFKNNMYYVLFCKEALRQYE